MKYFNILVTFMLFVFLLGIVPSSKSASSPLRNASVDFSSFEFTPASVTVLRKTVLLETPKHKKSVNPSVERKMVAR